MKTELTENEIKHVLNMSDMELKQFIRNMNYAEFYPYFITFNEKAKEKYSLLNRYTSVQKSIKELGGISIFPKEIHKKLNKIKKEWKIFRHVSAIISITISDKIMECKHDFEYSHTEGFSGKCDVYRCKLCGKERYK